MSGIIILMSVILFFVGAMVGSFLNVLIERTIADKDWIRGRSRCDSCLKTLNWYDMFPLLSYFWLGGLCRFCKKPIGKQHLVLEILTGSLFVWWYVFGFLFFQLTQQPLVFLQPLFWLLVGIILLVVLIIDFRYLIIPDWAVISLLLMAISYRSILVWFGIMQGGDLINMLIAAFSATALIFFLWLITGGKGMGFGDVKLMLPLSLLMGWPLILVGVFLSFLVGAVVGLILMILGKAKFGQPIPFGPFLIIGAVMSLFWGHSLLAWYIQLL